jgi:hypothetical protein
MVEYLCVLTIAVGFNVGFEVSFNNMQEWKGIREKAGEGK